MTRGAPTACSRVVLALIALACASTVRAQTPSVVYPGSVGGAEFGTAIATLGDVDGDGVPDFAATSPREDLAPGVDVGRARVISGSSGAVLHTFDGAGADDTFGVAVGAAGDVDGDGIGDVVVGATEVFPVTAPGPGYARVYSGATGALIHQWTGASPGSLFGGTVGSAGDLDGDGRAEVFVCANSVTRVYSGMTGALMYSLVGSKAAGARDVTGDGVPDVVTATSTVVRVYSGATGFLVRTQVVLSSFTPLVTLAGDMDFDGRDEIIISDTQSTLGAQNSGVVRVFSGIDGAPLHVIAGAAGELLGWATTNAGDVNGDGVDDFATATGFNVFVSGQLKVMVFSGASGALLETLVEPGPMSAFGWSLASADITLDGTPELLVGVLGDAPSGYASGSVFRFDHATPAYEIAYRNPGCGSAMPDPPVLRLTTQSGTPAATLEFLAGPPLGAASLVLGSPLHPDFAFFPTGCRLVIDPSQPYAILVTLPLDGQGAAVLGIQLPPYGGTGVTFHTQGVVVSSSGTLALTQGLALTFN